MMHRVQPRAFASSSRLLSSRPARASPIVRAGPEKEPESVKPPPKKSEKKEDKPKPADIVEPVAASAEPVEEATPEPPAAPVPALDVEDVSLLIPRCLHDSC